MASQHNRPSSYKALIEGNKIEPETREAFLHQKVFGDEAESQERKPHGLPSEEVLNAELKTMKVNPRAKSSIAGASSSTFHVYRNQRTQERTRIEQMYSEAAKEKEQEEFNARKRARDETEEDKTNARAAKRNKKKDAAKRRAEAFKQSAKSEQKEEKAQDEKAASTAESATVSPSAK